MKKFLLIAGLAVLGAAPAFAEETKDETKTAVVEEADVVEAPVEDVMTP